MPTIYYGRNGQKYAINESERFAGGEGTVYTLQGYPGSVAKIYHPDRLQKEGKARQEKIEAMVNLGINPYRNVENGKKILQIAWPEDVLYDASKRFCGFVMPRAGSLSNKISSLCGTLSRKKVFAPHPYTWGKSLTVAYNLAFVVKDLHESDVIIGDLNPDNFIINNDGTVTVIDVDSVAFSLSSKRFECMVGVGEFLAPEVNGGSSPRQGAVFTKETDRFSLAIHLFRLLMDGQHPFGVHFGNAKETNGGVSTADNIIHGRCAFFGSGLNEKDVGDGAKRIRKLLKLFPKEISDLFERCFCYNEKNAASDIVKSKRPTPVEWVTALYALDPEHLKICSTHPEHEYPKSCRACPWCEIESKKAISNAQGKQFNSQLTVNTGSPASTSRLPPPAVGHGQPNTNQTRRTASPHSWYSQPISTVSTSSVGRNAHSQPAPSGFSVSGSPRGPSPASGQVSQKSQQKNGKQGYTVNKHRGLKRFLRFILMLAILAAITYFALKYTGFDVNTLWKE